MPTEPYVTIRVRRALGFEFCFWGSEVSSLRVVTWYLSMGRLNRDPAKAPARHVIDPPPPPNGIPPKTLPVNPKNTTDHGGGGRETLNLNPKPEPYKP